MGHDFFIDDEIYTSNGTFPSEQVYIDEVREIRGHQVAILHICPFRYNPTQRVLNVYPDMEINISFKGNSKKVDSRLASTDFDKFIKGIAINPEAFSEYGSESSMETAAAAAGADFLIITDPAFLSAANSLSTHKVNLGMSTIVKTTNDTGTTTTAITNYIQDAFDTWTTAPSFVLLLGDAEHIPVHYVTTHPYHGIKTGTDLYYSTLSGSDYIPDIFLGRIPVDTLTEANTVVQKIINYETNPPALSTSAAVAAYFQDYNYDGYADRRFVRTGVEVRDFLLTKSYTVDRIFYTPSSVNPTNWNNGTYASGGAIPTELLRSSGFAWDGGASDITAAINSGIGFLLHRDHGADRNDGLSHTGWADPEYNETHISTLTNGSLLPVVFSINCMTGWFDGETDAYSTRNYESFCELFLTKSGGGAVSTIGASRVSYSGHNDFLSEGFFDCVWPEFLSSVPNNSGASSRLGQMLNHEKMAMDTIWGDPWGVALTEYEIFHVIGDPTLVMVANTGVIPPTVVVTAPNGGENWQVGTVHAITWNSSGIAGTVNIDYSTNGGGSWSSSAGSVSNTGSSSAISSSFTVSSSAQTGTTRMRVSMQWNAYASSCGSFTYGEVEDYTVNIQ